MLRRGFFLSHIILKPVTPQPPFRFGGKQRLKSRTLIQRLFAEGRSFHVPGFRVLHLPDNDFHFLQAGVSVSGRLYRKAADRNRIKRLMREGYRLQKSSLEEQLQRQGKRLSVFFICTWKQKPAFDEVRRGMAQALEQLQSLYA